MRLFTLTATIVLLLSVACRGGQSAAPATERTVSVHGTAMVPIKPNRVAFTAGVETRDPSATTAFRANSAKVQAVIAALKAHGATEQQMQTSYFDVGTTPAREKAPRSFKVSNLVRVVREDPADVGALIQAAVVAGANDVGNLSFFVADVAPFQQQGLAQAFKDARAKAEALARESQATLGDVLSVSDETAYPDNEMIGKLRSLGYVGAAPVQPGVEEMHFAVTVVFALR